MDPTSRGCPLRYFTFVNNFGVHNNPLLTLLNAFAVAKSLNPTLVVPPFIQGLNEYAVRCVIKPERFYDFYRTFGSKCYRLGSVCYRIDRLTSS